MIQQRLVDVDRGTKEIVTANTCGDLCEGRLLRKLCNEVHDTARLDLPVEQRSRSLDHFDPLDIERVDKYVAHAETIMQYALGETADRILGITTRKFARKTIHTGRITHHIEEIGGAGVFNKLLSERTDRKRQIGDRRVNTRGGNRIAGTIPFVLSGRNDEAVERDGVGS